MNRNPSAKTILCFGDSNTWGSVPGSDKRFPADVRWPGVLQASLGESYAVIEEGLSGRTTIYSHLSEPWKNGKDYIVPCLNTHDPIDLVILMLGTNDVKSTYGVEENHVGDGIGALVQIIKQTSLLHTPKTLIIAPPIILEKAKENPRMVNATSMSRLFAPRYEAVAQKYGCYYLNAGDIITSSAIDGYHLDKESHMLFGKEIAKFLKEKIEL